MFHKRHAIHPFMWAMLCIAALPCCAQDRPAEATPSVPALDSFHEVIYQIWHEAWPKKDTAMLRQLLPDVEKGIADVSGAPLPGILREKKSAWDEGVRKLQAVGSEYKASVQEKNDQALLDAAEKLHAQFETLVRTIRPPLRELDALHGVLYMLYHHYLPKNETAKIRSSAAELKEKMAALNAAKLPERRRQQEPQFNAARAKLSSSVDALAEVVKTGDERKIKSAVDQVHSDYQALDRVCE
jgi:hypothetical protein